MVGSGTCRTFGYAGFRCCLCRRHAVGDAPTQTRAQTPQHPTLTDKLKHKREHNRIKRNNASISSSFGILLKPTFPMIAHLMDPLHLMLSSQSRSIVACTLPHPPRFLTRHFLHYPLFFDLPRLRGEMVQRSFISCLGNIIRCRLFSSLSVRSFVVLTDTLVDKP